MKDEATESYLCLIRENARAYENKSLTCEEALKKLAKLYPVDAFKKAINEWKEEEALRRLEARVERYRAEGASRVLVREGDHTLEVEWGPWSEVKRAT